MNLETKVFAADNDTLYSPDSPFSLPLRIDNFSCEKDFDKFIKYVEKIVRCSIEYRYWVSFITDNLGCNTCSLTKESMSETDVEVHHHPIMLYTICRCITTDFLNSRKQFCSFDVATKVIELHFQNKIGYVTLLSDIHKKYHDGFQQIPIEMIHGDYKYLVSNFPIDDQELQRISSLCNIHAKDIKQSWSRDNYPGLNEIKN